MRAAFGEGGASLRVTSSRFAILGFLVLAAAAMAATVVGRGFTALSPDPTDALLFAYIGEQMANGQILYRDLWDNKPPGIFIVNALAAYLTDQNFLLLAALEGAFVLAAIAGIYSLMRTAGAPLIANAVAVAGAALACNLSYFNERGNLTEIYLLLPAVLSMLCFLKAGRPPWRGGWVFAAGLATGFATVFKPTGLSPFLAQSAFLLLSVWSGQISRRSALVSSVQNAAGIVSVWLPFLVYAWHYGVLRELFEASVWFNLHYGLASQRGLIYAGLNLIERLQPISTLLIGACLALAGLLAALWSAPTRPTRVLLGLADRERLAILVALWAGFDLLGAVAGGRFYPHYFLPLALSLSVAAGYGAWYLLESAAGAAGRRWIGSAALALMVGPLLFESAKDVSELGWLLLQDRPLYLKSSNHLRVTEVSRRVPGDWRDVAAWLERSGHAGDTLFTWDYEPALFFESGMGPVTRHLDAHRMGDFPGARQRVGEEVLKDLHERPPTFIVDATVAPDEQAASEAYYGAFRAFLDQRYSPVYAKGKYQVYRLKETGGPRGRGDPAT